MAAAVGSIVVLVTDMDYAASTVAGSMAQQADAGCTGDLAEQVQINASDLGQRADTLRREVAHFISSVKAA